MNFTVDISRFRHIHRITVRNYEIDWQGIVHNGNYLLYFEVARVEYFRALGMQIDERSINGSVRIVIARNELDHIATATFDDVLRIHTRITAVRNSSFLCEAVMFNERTNALVAKNVCVMVWTDPKSGRSSIVPNEVRDLVDAYEQGTAKVDRPDTTI